MTFPAPATNARGVYPDFTKETLVDHAYFVLESRQSLDEKWPLILQYRPDLIKIILVHSEEYERRRDDPEYFGQKGLNPDLVPMIVARAHAHGLRVSAHVNSGRDFHVAVTAGVDELAHLPGCCSPQAIAPEDAAHYEASFISLDADPLKDWSALERIRYRFKDGRPLRLSD